MRAFDVSGIAAALVLAPACAWLFGRFAGRRDWNIITLLALGLVLGIVLQTGILAVHCWLEALSPTAARLTFVDLFARRALEAMANPEFSVFLLIFGVFVAMLGWSATPAVRRSDNPRT